MLSVAEMCVRITRQSRCMCCSSLRGNDMATNTVYDLCPRLYMIYAFRVVAFTDCCAGSYNADDTFQTRHSLLSTGIASVKSPVQNISEHTRIDLDLLHHTLASSFVQQYSENARGSNVHLVRVDPDALVRQSSLLASMRATMASWEWIFAGGPVFSYAAPLQLRRSTLAPAGHAHRASGTLNFRVKKGYIDSVALGGATADMVLTAQLSSALVGVAFFKDHMVAALNAATSLDDHTKDSVIASLECIY
eukprot:m.555503 g.555503  ORF g.555503 m.555503 type:complete len:249 (-) comp22181_c0_seq43:451-1197(-)